MSKSFDAPTFSAAARKIEREKKLGLRERQMIAVTSIPSANQSLQGLTHFHRGKNSFSAGVLFMWGFWSILRWKKTSIYALEINNIKLINKDGLQGSLVNNNRLFLR